MLNLFRAFILILLFGTYSIANASIPAENGWKWTAMGETSDNVFRTPIAACKAAASKHPPWFGAPEPVTVNGGSCTFNGMGSGYRVDEAVGAFCTESSTKVGGACECNTGFKEDGKLCVAKLSDSDACGAAFYNSGAFQNGTSSVTLDGQISSGSYCQPQGDDVKPGLACATNFNMDVAWKTDDGKWKTRGTLQPKMIGSNFQACIPGLDSTSPPKDDKPPELPKKSDNTCPNGYKGDVGDKTGVCVPSYGYNGVNFAPKTNYTETEKARIEITTEVKCELGKCTTTVTEKNTDKVTGNSTTSVSTSVEQDRDWCAKAENKDKCTANGKPPYVGQGTTGTGSSGTGGTGSGGNGDGDDKGGKCGAKDQVPCKIDEKDTPTGEGKLDKFTDQLNQDHQKRMDTLNDIKSTGDKNTSMGFEGGFGWLTHRPCMPWNLGTYSIMGQSIDISVNICAIEPLVAPVMNFLWVLATIFFTVGRVASVMGSKVD